MPGLLPVVTFPDSELWLCDYLRQEIAAAAWPDPVRIGVDYIQGGQAIQVRRDGGPRVSAVLEAARFTANIFAPDPTGVTVGALTQLVRALIGSCPGAAVTGWNSRPVKLYTELSGPILVDQSNEIPCRMITFELLIQGSTP